MNSPSFKKRYFELLCQIRHSELTDKDGFFQIKKTYLRASREAAKIANTQMPDDELFDNKDNSAHEKESECNEVDCIQCFTEPSRRSGRSARPWVNETCSTKTFSQIEAPERKASQLFLVRRAPGGFSSDKEGSAYT